ncbi:hypothetical protein V4F30_26445, partial [Rhodococcus sp. IITD102]|uniref:hypothetical protein n=1 Tax=Rhodococcus TaxID=1827 RepID=UPI001C3FB71C
MAITTAPFHSTEVDSAAPEHEPGGLAAEAALDPRKIRKICCYNRIEFRDAGRGCSSVRGAHPRRIPARSGFEESGIGGVVCPIPVES